jgi:signal peptidase II
MHNGSNENTPSTSKGGVFKSSGLWWLWISVLAVVSDQATKWWIIDAVEYGEHMPVFSWFDITHAHNLGAAFSFLHDAGGWQRYFLTGVALVISVLLLWWMKSTPKSNKVLGMSYSLILGGAIGNVYDRIMYGYVEDFIYIYYQSWDFPAFNIADSTISLGAILLIYDALTAKPEKPKDEVTSD